MKKAIKRTFAILAAATTLLVSGAMTASASVKYPASRYDGHAHGQFIEWQTEESTGKDIRICRACGHKVWYNGSYYR